MKVLTIIKYELIELLRDRSAWLTMLILPVILTFILVNISSRHEVNTAEEQRIIPIGIYLEDEGGFAGELVAELKQQPNLQVFEESIDRMAGKVKEASLVAGFIIEEGFTADFESASATEIPVLNINKDTDYFLAINTIQTVYEKLSMEKIVKERLESEVRELGFKDSPEILQKVDSGIEQIFREPPILSVEKRKTGQNAGELSAAVETDQHYSIGMIVMFIMFTIMTGAGVVLKEKKLKTWQRFLSTPTNKTTILFSKMLGTFVTGWLQILILVIFGNFVLHIYFGNSLFVTFLVFTVYMFSIAGVGIFLSSMINSYAQLNTILTITIISTSMLSGCYWPVWLMPAFMQKLALIFPQYWAIKALEIVMLPDYTMAQIIFPVLILLGIGVLFLLLSSLFSRVKLKKNV